MKVKYICLILITLSLVQCTEMARVYLVEFEVDKSAGNVPWYKTETQAAVHFLEKEGAGFSSIVDSDGNDWIGFHPESGTEAGGGYRGFPNTIHK